MHPLESIFSGPLPFRLAKAAPVFVCQPAMLVRLEFGQYHRAGVNVQGVRQAESVDQDVRHFMGHGGPHSGILNCRLCLLSCEPPKLFHLCPAFTWARAQAEARNSAAPMVCLDASASGGWRWRDSSESETAAGLVRRLKERLPTEGSHWGTTFCSEEGHRVEGQRLCAVSLGAKLSIALPCTARPRSLHGPRPVSRESHHGPVPLRTSHYPPSED